ncbi:hypothetical protein C8C76_104127 [Halanaerobium saccharolyticum]|jgi:hypothetical protein|uniref:YdhG-like domain-containing protein n=1 Tax=Halanaerobium saccharolyticum TaxID=43595 RepID=A0A2T5RPN1_9FIRM|nr:hypothetical protein [Halanaerobium saccharolyticum]PTW01773.1 hypothetical protein C8C76_104127 [Halanaerobium saccharolyticum]
MKDENKKAAELMRTFKMLKKILEQYEGPLKLKFDLKEKYELWTDKEVNIAGKTKKELFFAGVTLQKNYISFYFMPIYVEPELKEKLEPKLLKLLKGKSCFHIKSIDKELENEIFDALQKGYKLYEENEWIN